MARIGISFSLVLLLAALIPSRTIAQPSEAELGPRRIGDRLDYDNVLVPRYETEAEREFRRAFPRTSQRAVTPPPTGPIHCAAEYEPMAGILMSWDSGGDTAIDTIIKNMVKEITTNAAAGPAKVYMVVDTTSERTTVQNALTAWGVNMANVEFIIQATNSIWIRDYGPRYIYQGQCRAVIDHDYNRPTRAQDDAFSSPWATWIGHAFYEHQLVHGGGNYHLDALDRSYATELIWNENPGLTHTQIHDIWQDYQNVDTHIFPPFPTSIDATQHIDMWMQVIADNKVIISDWPNNVGSTQDVICDNATTYMTGQGYAVHRVPARSVGGAHYTYTNVVMCNNLVLLPTYTNASVSPHNAPALAAWQAALPTHTFVQINCQGIVTLAGVMHCIVMHVPAHLGGANPTAYLKNLRGGETLTPSTQVEIQWISDDDVNVTNVDILLSTNGGTSFDTVLASATADDGSFLWTVPNVYTTHARIRVVARDASANTGQDQSDSDITINGAPVPGDLTCDVVVDELDVEPFVTALLSPGDFTECNINAADVNGDTFTDGLDVTDFTTAVVTP